MCKAACDQRGAVDRRHGTRVPHIAQIDAAPTDSREHGSADERSSGSSPPVGSESPNLGDQRGNVLTSGGNEVLVGNRRWSNRPNVGPRDIHVWLIVGLAYSDEVITAPVIATFDEGFPRSGGRGSATGFDCVKCLIVEHEVSIRHGSAQ